MTPATDMAGSPCWRASRALAKRIWRASSNALRSSAAHKSFGDAAGKVTAHRHSGVGAADLGALMPELRARLPQLPEAPDASGARFRLFDNVTRLLCHASQQQPLLVVLDDLHRADEASLRLLLYLAGELAGARLLVLATYRDTEPRPSIALSQVVATASHPIRLAGLGESEVARLMENADGRVPSAPVVAAVYERTEGNPFFVTELVRLLASKGWSDPDHIGGLRQIPGAVREAIRIRLAGLSEPCQRVLQTASVIGREFDLDLLHAVVGASSHVSTLSDGAAPSDQWERSIEKTSAAGLDLLDEARTAGFVDRGSNAIGRYRFSHVLIRDTVYEELGSSHRVALHRQIGEAVEVLHQGILDRDVPALAHHFYEAIPNGMAPKAFEYATRAAQRSASIAAFEDAIDHYEHALQALDHCPPGAVTPAGTLDELVQRCDLLIALGEAQYNAGLRSPSRTTLLKAAALARQLTAPEPLARAALALIGPGEWMADVDMDAVELLGAALTALGSKDSALRAQLLSRLAGVLYYSIASQRRVSLSREAIAVAQRLEDPDTEALVLGNAHFALLGPDNVEERLAFATRIVELAEAAGSTARAMSGHYWRLLDLLQLGDIAAADIALHHYSNYAAELRQPFDVWRAASARAMRALLAGRLDEGERLAFEAFAAGERANSPNRMLTLASQLYTLRREQGRLHELEAEVKHFVEQYATVPATRGALALLYSELGREAEARAEFEKLAARDFADVPRDVSWLNALDMAAQVCAFLGDCARAGILYNLLLPHAQQNVIVAYADASHGAVAHSLGLLAATLGRWDDAAQHFENALELNTRLGAPHFVARTQHAYAEMLLRVSSPALPAGEQEKAMALLNNAIAIYERLGMTSYLQQGLALRERVRERQRQERAIAERNVFRFDGKRWTIVWRGEPVHVRKAPALTYLAYLLRHPGRWISVIDLQQAATLTAASAALSPDDHLQMMRPDVGEPVLDGRALRACRARLRELRDERDAARRLCDAARLAAIEAELEAIERQLRRGNVGNTIDQLRKNVSKAIVRARAAIRRRNSSLGEYLEEQITYELCSFRYEPADGVEWET